MISEDEMYRASTQYRLWNFTPERLATLRQKTNSMARDHVKAALKRERKSLDKHSKGRNSAENDQSVPGTGHATSEGEDTDIEFLTVDEERTLIDFFCVNLITLAKHRNFQLPTNVVVCQSTFGRNKANANRLRPSNLSNASLSRIQ
jgi:cyclin H